MAKQPVTLTKEMVLAFLKDQPDILTTIADERAKLRITELTNQINGAAAEIKEWKKSLKKLCSETGQVYPFNVPGRGRAKAK